MKLNCVYNKNSRPILYEFASVDELVSIVTNHILYASIAVKIFPIKHHSKQKAKDNL